MATTQRAGLPYIWPSWITGFLAGEAHCRFRPWFQAHFKYDKRADKDFDFAAWTADHTRLLRARAEQLEADGWTIRVEEQNRFALKGKVALVGGKPDIIATKKIGALALILVVDVKTGKPKDADWWQVLLYMLAYRLLDESVRTPQIEGEVCYPDGQAITIKPEELTREREQDIYTAIKWVAGRARPKTVPSAFECRRCDIKDCRDRVDDEADAKEVDGF